jgi:hypothetical protein
MESIIVIVGSSLELILLWVLVNLKRTTYSRSSPVFRAVHNLSDRQYLQQWVFLV